MGTTTEGEMLELLQIHRDKSDFVGTTTKTKVPSYSETEVLWELIRPNIGTGWRSHKCAAFLRAAGVPTDPSEKIPCWESRAVLPQPPAGTSFVLPSNKRKKNPKAPR